jgi:peroxiredoxin
MVYQLPVRGLPIHSTAPNFHLVMPNYQPYTCDSLMGGRGLLLTFLQGIWEPSNIRRILHLLRNQPKFEGEGIHSAIILAEEPQTLYNFYVSSPTTITVPLLADPEQVVHTNYGITTASLVLIDTQKQVRAQWFAPGEMVFPKARDLVAAMQSL